MRLAPLALFALLGCSDSSSGPPPRPTFQLTGVWSGAFTSSSGPQGTVLVTITQWGLTIPYATLEGTLFPNGEALQLAGDGWFDGDSLSLAFPVESGCALTVHGEVTVISNGEPEIMHGDYSAVGGSCSDSGYWALRRQ